MSRVRRPTASPAALDSDDILADVLLRLPPRPSFLPRAGFVCKHWRRLVTDPEFLRRFRAHHGAPPLLGFFLQDASFVPTLDPPDRVAAARLSLDRRDCESRRWGWELRSCLHGLLLCENAEEFLVHDPVAGDRIRVPFPQQDRVPITAAVLAAGYGDDTERRRFNLVALVTDDSGRRMFASVYSSDSGVWVDSAATFLLPLFIHLPSTIVGNATYWIVDRGILKFDSGTRKLLLINFPPDRSVRMQLKCKIVPAGKDDQLRLAVLDEPTIRFWESETDPDGAVKWVLRKTVQLDKSIPLGSDMVLRLPRILGFAEGSNIIFLGTRLGIFMINLDSMQFRKVLDGNNVSYIFPYSSFLTAGKYLTRTASATSFPTQTSKLQ